MMTDNLIEIKSWPAKPRNCAIKRKKLSAPMQWLFDKGLIWQGADALDFGCGYGDDAHALLIDGFDPHHRWFGVDRKYKIVTCIYVMNVIRRPQDRAEALKNVRRCLRPGGDAFIAVRRDKAAWSGHQQWVEYDLEHFKDMKSLVRNRSFEIYHLQG